MPTLHLTHFYWDQTGFCGTACNLTHDQEELFQKQTSPHVSLTKPRDTNWEDAGRFMARCENTNTWGVPKHGVSCSVVIFFDRARGGTHERRSSCQWDLFQSLKKYAFSTLS